MMKRTSFIVAIGILMYLLGGIGVALAQQDAPDPPDSFFRADERSPDFIFGVPAGPPGPGFSTWAAARGVPINDNALQHAAGLSVAPSPEGNRDSNWISVAASLTGVVDGYLGNEVVRRVRFDVRELPRYWIYQIAPTQAAYDMRWMLRGTSEDGETAEDRNLARQLLRTYRHLDEWIVQGGIPLSTIQSATLYQFNIDTDRYEAIAGRTVQNPYYRPPPAPVRQVLNPMLGDTVENAESVGYEPEELRPILASIAALSLYAASCAGVGASGVDLVPNAITAVNVAPKAPSCDYSVKAVKQYQMDDLPTIQSQLVVRTHTNVEYCLRPVNSVTPSQAATRTYLYLDNCDSSIEAQRAIFTVSGQIAFPRDEFGIPMCITAPENVVNGDSSWDWVQLWPCDRSNPYQSWVIHEGRIYSRVNPTLYIQDNKFYGVMSKANNGFDNVLVQGQMTPNFFVDTSREISDWFEIGVSFEQSGTRYYPFDVPVGSPVSKNYSNRIYYDEGNGGRIIMLAYYGRAFRSSGNTLYCLQSRQVTSGSAPWDWAFWVSCPAYLNNTPDGQKWTIDNDNGSTPITLVHFVDNNGNRLFANLADGSNFGWFYTSSRITEPQGTDDFSTLRRYGFCLGDQGHWYVCLDPKHTVSENDVPIVGLPDNHAPLLNGRPPNDPGYFEHLENMSGQ